MGDFANFFLLGFHDAGSESGDLIVVELLGLGRELRAAPAETLRGAADYFRARKAWSRRRRRYFRRRKPGAASDSAPASASSQRGRPPVKRRGTSGCRSAAVARVDQRWTADEFSRVFGGSSVGCGSATGAEEDAAGLPRYFASDSPGRRIGSSAASKFGALEEGPPWRGVSGRRLSKPRSRRHVARSREVASRDSGLDCAGRCRASPHVNRYAARSRHLAAKRISRAANCVRHQVRHRGGCHDGVRHDGRSGRDHRQSPDHDRHLGHRGRCRDRCHAIVAAVGPPPKFWPGRALPPRGG